MLNQMRSLAGSFFAKLLLGLLVLSFVIWGIEDMVRMPSRNAIIAKVGSSEISRSAFENTLRGEIDNIRRSMGERFSPEIVAALNIPKRVLQKIINRTLLRLESDALGIAPSDTDIARRIRSNPAFTDEQGNFSKDIFTARLRSAGMDEKEFINQQRIEISLNLLMSSISDLPEMPLAAVETMYAALNEKRVAEVYVLNVSSINTPQPDDAQVEAYYKEHSDLFSMPETRILNYVTVKPDNLPQNITVTDEELRVAYAERQEEFKQPEKRRVEQLLFGTEDAAKNAHTQLVAGKSLDAVSKSPDVVNKNAISLGSIDQSRIVDNAAAVVFALQKDEYTAPIQTPFGWHIFHVSEIFPPRIAPFEDARETLEKDLRAHKVEEAFSQFTNQLEDALAAGATLQEAAKEMKLPLATIGPVTQDGTDTDGKAIKGIPDLDKFLANGFKLHEKTESPLSPSKDGVYYIVRADQILPEHARPLEEVRAQVITHWKQNFAHKQVEERADLLNKQFSNADTRTAAIAEYKLKQITVPPVKRADNGDILPSP